MKISVRFLLCFAVAFSVSQSFADDIRSTTGEVFRNAKILRSEPDGLVIQHSVGVAKVPFEELPISLQKHFGFDPGRAAAFRAKAAEQPKSSVSPVVQPSAPPAVESPSSDVIESNFGQSEHGERTSDQYHSAAETLPTTQAIETPAMDANTWLLQQMGKGAPSPSAAAYPLHKSKNTDMSRYATPFAFLILPILRSLLKRKRDVHS